MSAPLISLCVQAHSQQEKIKHQKEGKAPNRILPSIGVLGMEMKWKIEAQSGGEKLKTPLTLELTWKAGELGKALVPQAPGPCFSQEFEGIWHLNSLGNNATGSLGIATLIAAIDPTRHRGETKFPSFFSHHNFSIVLFLERAFVAVMRGKNIKDDKGEREQRYRTKFSARIFTLGWEIKKELKEIPDGEFLAALMSQPLTFGHVSQKAPADSLTYSQLCALGTGSGLIHPWLGNQSPNPVLGVSTPTPFPLSWTPQAKSVP